MGWRKVWGREVSQLVSNPVCARSKKTVWKGLSAKKKKETWGALKGGGTGKVKCGGEYRGKHMDGGARVCCALRKSFGSSNDLTRKKKNVGRCAQKKFRGS